ncbi:MAG: hypothetical protein QM704_20525 [Anaeromyxobacteraceae bacterium]
MLSTTRSRRSRSPSSRWAKARSAAPISFTSTSRTRASPSPNASGVALSRSTIPEGAPSICTVTVSCEGNGAAPSAGGGLPSTRTCRCASSSVRPVRSAWAASAFSFTCRSPRSSSPTSGWMRSTGEAPSGARSAAARSQGTMRGSRSTSFSRSFGRSAARPTSRASSEAASRAARRPSASA